jgi:hypothetical protein
MQLGSYFVSARTNKRHHNHLILFVKQQVAKPEVLKIKGGHWLFPQP